MQDFDSEEDNTFSTSATTVGQNQQLDLETDSKNKDFYILLKQNMLLRHNQSEKSVIYERILLPRMNHPFIINMHYSFQDKDNLYIVMDLLTGGDLRYHLCKQKKFDEEQTSKNIFYNINI